MLISGREEPEAPLSPAMDAVIRIFKRISGLADSEGDAKVSGPAGVAFCSIRLLVASTQAINLIGKQGSLIKSIQESTGASVRVLSGGMLLLLHNTTFLYSVEYQWLEISPSSYHLFPMQSIMCLLLFMWFIMKLSSRVWVFLSNYFCDLTFGGLDFLLVI